MRLPKDATEPDASEPTSKRPNPTNQGIYLLYSSTIVAPAIVPMWPNTLRKNGPCAELGSSAPAVSSTTT